MRSAKTVAVLLLLALSAAGEIVGGGYDGARALEATRKVVSFGARTPGSPGMKKMQAFLTAELKRLGWEVIEDAFTAKTPKGPLAMKNVIARRSGMSGKAVALSGHMDTKFFPFPFVGANDAGSSTGFLLEMARTLKSVPLKNDVYLVFFDGEEAVVDWTPEDSLYGSRHLAERWQKDGTNARLLALINVDMIGDRDLKLVNEQYSSQPLMQLIRQVARDLGYGQHLSNDALPIEDDHAPFLRKGVRAADLIDFEYGPNHSWWHTPQDTMDKLSAKSFEVVGRTLVEVLRRLEPR
jgi:Zn-dependent M28 family amino/carboxypeptidase